MKKLALCIFFALFSFFSCDDIDTCTFAEDGGRMYVTVENTLDESVSAKVVIVEKQENTGEWSLAGNWREKVGKCTMQEKRVKGTQKYADNAAPVK